MIDKYTHIKLLQISHCRYVPRRNWKPQIFMESTADMVAFGWVQIWRSDEDPKFVRYLANQVPVKLSRGDRGYVVEGIRHPTNKVIIFSAGEHSYSRMVAIGKESSIPIGPVLEYDPYLKELKCVVPYSWHGTTITLNPGFDCPDSNLACVDWEKVVRSKWKTYSETMNCKKEDIFADNAYLVPAFFDIGDIVDATTDGLEVSRCVIPYPEQFKRAGSVRRNYVFELLYMWSYISLLGAEKFATTVCHSNKAFPAKDWERMRWVSKLKRHPLCPTARMVSFAARIVELADWSLEMFHKNHKDVIN